MTIEACKKCGSINLVEKPHPVHTTGLWCHDCGAWIKWVGNPDKDPKAFWKAMREIPNVKQPGFAFAKFRHQFDRWPTREEQGE